MRFANDIAFRKEILQKLLHNIQRHEPDIVEALHKDLGKPAFEAMASETAYVISDLRHTLRKLDSWSRKRRVGGSLLNFPSSNYIVPEPYGKVLIISPWNYPFQLAIAPLVAAIAAGNSVVLKPSELTPATSAWISRIVRETFDVKHAVAVLGDATIAADLLQKKWDYIFFTGSTTVGKIVAKAAAVHLTPVTLELGGKNPCVVDSTANIDVAARRIVWGKFFNAGQTCIAPDYLLVHHKIKSRLIAALQREIERAFGSNPADSPDLARIVNNHHFHRILSLIDPKKVVCGGQSDPDTRYVAPTIIDESDLHSPLMQDEIFGPLLPVVAYDKEDTLAKIIGKQDKPLAFYVFSQNKAFTKRLLSQHRFGGGCINDTMIHFTNKKLPFGGVGASGMGAYHGKFGFDTFSHHKSIVDKPFWPDFPFRYAPYGQKAKWLSWLLRRL